MSVRSTRFGSPCPESPSTVQRVPDQSRNRQQHCKPAPELDADRRHNQLTYRSTFAKQLVNVQCVFTG
jgi:hypothetical protein